MSQWRIRGYVLDSDEEDDLDFDDSYPPKSPPAKTAPVGRPDTPTNPAPDPLKASGASPTGLIGSQDELALDSSQGALLNGACLPPVVAKPTGPPMHQTNTLSPQCGPHMLPDLHTVDSELPTDSVKVPAVGHPSSETVTASSANALSKTFLATQLFSDEPLTSTPRPFPQELLERPITPTRQDDGVDELQQDWSVDQNGNISAFSSPLSDARSDIEPPDHLTSSPPLAALPRQVPEETAKGSRQSVQVVIPPREVTPLDETDAEELRIRRALRKRNPIQLHPYALEAEKYKQNLKSRGLRPVGVVSEHHRHHEKQHETSHAESQGQDSQDRDFVVDHTQSSSVRHSSPVEFPSSPPNLERAISVLSRPNDAVNMNDPHMNVDDEDFDFPDLSALLRRKHDDSVQHGFKRRKMLHTFSRKGSSLSRTSSLPQPLPHASNTGRPQQPNVLFEVPPSPPPSETLPNQSEQLRKPHRPPQLRRLSPIRQPQPPTPATSSTRKPARIRRVDSDSDDEPPISTARHRGLQRTTSIAVLSSSESSSDERGEGNDDGKDEKGLKQARRRIKGVLPASWLRLDQQAQANRKPFADPPRHQRVNSDASTRPGTAGPSIASRRASPAPSSRQENDAGPILIEDDRSESGADSSSTKVPQSRRDLEEDLGFGDSLIDGGTFEVQEHDWVDPMLPSASRQNPNKKPRKKRQLKLTDTMDARAKPHRLDSSDRPVRLGATRVGKPKQKANDRQRPRRAPKSRPLELSILDAPILNAEGPTKAPKFLRIAARQARRHPNKGRHSPTHKVFRLQTEADTEDANLALRDWREGRVKRSTRDDVDFQTARPPLNDRVANLQGELYQQRLPDPAKLQSTEVHRTGDDVSGQEAARGDASKPRMRQTRLNGVPMLRDTSPVPPSKSRQSKSKISIAHRPTIQKPKPKQPEYRTAQLERVETEYESRDRAAAFRRKLSQLDRMYAKTNQVQFQDAWKGQSRNPRLERFLEDVDEIESLPIPPPVLAEVVPSIEKEVPRAPPKPRRKLKTNVQRVDIETREYRQPSDPIPQIQERLPSSPIQILSLEAPRLEGLGSYGSRYPTGFDVSRLWTGTFFHESTLIGSGDFEKALKTGCRDLDAPAGLSTFSYNGAVFRWGAWTEEVASEMASLLSSSASLLEGAQSHMQDDSSDDVLLAALTGYLCILRNISRYLSTSLHFLDPVDRRSCVTRMQNLLDSASGSILADLANPSGNPFRGKGTERMRFLLSVLLALLALQVTQIAGHQQDVTSGQESTDLLFKALIRPALRLVLRKGIGELRGYIDENRRHVSREQGIREDKLAVEAVVMVNHMLLAREMPRWSIWDLIKDEWSSSVANYCHVQSFECLWYDIFALLPYMEIDQSGLVRPGHCTQSTKGDWSVVVAMLNRLFTLYAETARTNEASVNGYFRSCLMRCYNLFHVWGWKKCDSLLTSVFDFFSRRGFNNLRSEESKGSPRFLEDLHQHPRLEIQPDDRAFHMFLKMLAVGFRGMRSICKERQIQNIAWRLVPNHRRTYHKEEDLRQEDLDGLRNQHDLLCTLYWASPPGFRPRLTSLRNLVDQNRSHREVCRLSVRAWSNLARYQISTDEGKEPLEPFTDWFREIVSQNQLQYKLARSEAEAQYEAARSSGNDTISAEQLQLTIKNNQAQIVATLGDAVYGMKAAISAASDPEIATLFLSQSAVADVLKLFDAKNTQPNRLLAEVLEVFQTCLKSLRSRESQVESQQISDDSQDYGSGFSLEELEPTVVNDATSSQTSIDIIHDAVWQLVSSCFGADPAPEDALLMTVVQTWTMIAHYLVRKGQRDWSNFLDAYHPNSWRQLQDMEQTRRYTALFMAMVLDQDARSYDNHKDDVFWSWFISLVERESTLKFQHRLTTSLINRGPDHPLFRNLPFLVDPSGRVDIKLSEFRQRRLGLISSVLSNMRDDYEAAMQAGHRDLPGLRREYTGLLKQFMTAMKKNYLDLGQDSNAKGAYVEFVHKVVEFLQQHTHDICPVDQFFTDSSAFPLPATDPTYVVGRLKSYVPKLSEQRTLKQLVSFVQNVSERAAVDNEQEYLISQLCTAAIGTPERGGVGKPTLRQVLLCAIFPAYIEQAFRTTAGWIFAKPLLQASSPILEELNYQGCQYSIFDPESVATVDALLSIMLDALYSTTELLITHSGLLEQPHVLHVLAPIFKAVAATVLPASHIYRRTGRAIGALQRIDGFKAFSLFVASSIVNPEDANVFSPYLANDPDPLADEQTQRFAEVRQLCTRNLAEALGGKHWVQQGEQYFLLKKNGGRAIHTAVGSLEEERTRVVHAIEAFHARLGVALWNGEDDLKEKRLRGKEGRWPMAEGQMVVI